MAMTNNKQWFDSKEFEQQFHTHLPLGAFCSEDGTLFRLWAPTASGVQLRLYPAGNDCLAMRVISMEQGEHGTWSYQDPQNLHGSYYDYAVTVENTTYETCDPYAKACGVNGQRSMVLDLSTTDPENWHQDAAPAQTTEQVIYELHIKDFSWDPAGGFAEADRGRFSALTRRGTTLNTDGIHPTGLDYMKQLGVTHVQLMPIYDYGSVDECAPEKGYNWGYDPVNYNIPEGSYSSNPYHGQVRVRELKEMIAALHENGFRVIMDVVYNHTYDLNSSLFKTAPWYYYRQKEDGAVANGSGCGNDVATERSMVSRYILESVLYWVEEYHIDGFRFDLMGLMDVPLMNRIQQVLDERYGEGEKLLYGEPWRADNTAARPGTILADKTNLKQLNANLGAFCDDVRDVVKGKIMNIEAVGFVNGGRIDAEELGRCVAGWAGDDLPNQSPSQNITYLSCHDDWTLWDKLVYTMDPQKRFTESRSDILRANRMGVAINFFCQGRPFFLAGEEFGRTKGGIKNSYCSSADINQLDWTRAWENQDLVDYYRGLIALRKQLPGLQDKTVDARRRILQTKQVSETCAYVLVDNGTEQKYDQLLLITSNCTDQEPVCLPQGKWQLLVDGDSAFLWQQNLSLEGCLCVKGQSSYILGRIQG